MNASIIFILKSIHASIYRRIGYITMPVFVLLLTSSISVGQIHGTPGTSVFDSVMNFQTIKNLPPDTTKHFHIEPDEEEEMDHNLKPDPSVPVFH